MYLFNYFFIYFVTSDNGVLDKQYDIGLHRSMQ